MLECLPETTEASCSYWSTRFGGSGSESQKTMLEGEYNKGQVILSRNQLFTIEERLFIQLPEDLQAEAMFGSGSIFCGKKQI